MLGIVLTIIASTLLLIQSLGFYELIPMLSYSAFGNDNIIILYIHSCLCKWGLPVSALTLIMGVCCLFDKDDNLKMREHIKTYAIWVLIWALLSFL